MAKRITGSLQPNWFFYTPGGQLLTVVAVRSVSLEGYVEVETKQPYLSEANTWFTAPNTYMVEVLDCVTCRDNPATVKDAAMPRGPLGNLRVLCAGCWEKLENDRYNLEHYG